MRHGYTFIPLLVCLMLSSCKKECTDKAPVVTIFSPAEANNIQLPDSIQITGTINDDVWLNSATIMLHNTSGDTVFASRPDVYGKKDYAFNYSYFSTVSGSLRLQVVAEDNKSHTAEKEVMFNLLP